MTQFLKVAGFFILRHFILAGCGWKNPSLFFLLIASLSTQDFFSEAGFFTQAENQALKICTLLLEREKMATFSFHQAYFCLRYVQRNV